MMAHRYDPRIHHRRSLRLKGHDYAGGGAYFVTICAHRNAGDIFAPESVKEMVAQVWIDLPNSRALAGAGLVPASSSWKENPYVVMPDHFHAIVAMRPGTRTLGDVVGAFKSLVVHEYIAGVKDGRFAPFPGKVWHRNYHDRIIRDADELANVQNYIRMNPWKLIQEGTHEGHLCRMIGNPSLLNWEKIGMLCSRNCPANILAAAEQRAQAAQSQHCFLGGFHSPPEKKILAAMLKSKTKLICCPAWGIDAMKIPAEWLPALEQNRMLILEMHNRDGDLAAAEERNTFVMQAAEELWVPHVTPGGMLAHLIETQDAREKIIEDR